MPKRIVFLVLVLGLVAAACTPSSSPTTSDEPGQTTTTTLTPPTTQPLNSSGTPGENPSDGGSGEEPLEPPHRGDPFDTASNAFGEVGEFTTAQDRQQYETDALQIIEAWLPEQIIDALVWEAFNDGSDDNVLALSVLPALTWRGDPNFVPALLETLTDGETAVVLPGMFKVTTSEGLILFAQSTGDGFMLSTSATPDSAMRYLEVLAAESEPQTVWKEGACLYVDPETETLPYAPFPEDIVVPCNGAHNAEVLVSRQIGTDLVRYDDDSIAYDRSYECDKAYTEAFGSQVDHKPEMVTYMPDEDEWDRGDRYLACVVELQTEHGPLLFAGQMSERTDLVWNPDVGTCLDESLAPGAVDCTRTHSYQFIGETNVDLETWPIDSFTVFTEACQDLLNDFVADGPAPIDVFATGLAPYAFEQGDRTVRCIAFALDDGLLADVSGSFDSVWRIVVQGGTAA